MAQKPKTFGFCDECASEGELTRNKKSGKNLCQQCYRSKFKELCVHCGVVNNIGQRNADGTAICATCLYHIKRGQTPKKTVSENDIEFTITCKFCVRLKQAYAQYVDGLWYCEECKGKAIKKLCPDCSNTDFLVEPYMVCQKCTKARKQKRKLCSTQNTTSKHCDIPDGSVMCAWCKYSGKTVSNPHLTR